VITKLSLEDPEQVIRARRDTKIVVGGDLNVWNVEWSPLTNNPRGELLSEFAASLRLVLPNSGDTYTFVRVTLHHQHHLIQGGRGRWLVHSGGPCLRVIQDRPFTAASSGPNAWMTPREPSSHLAPRLGSEVVGPRSILRVY